jgi:hypothetical protein
MLEMVRVGGCWIADAPRGGDAEDAVFWGRSRLRLVVVVFTTAIDSTGLSAEVKVPGWAQV